MSSVSKGSSIPLQRRKSSIFEEAVRSRSNEIWKHAFQACQNHFPRKRRKKKAFWSRIIYLTGCYEVYCSYLFAIINEKFCLSFLVFAAPTLRHPAGLGW